MGFDELVRNGVALAKTLTADIRANVTHEAWISRDVHAKPTYAAGVVRSGIVEQKQVWVKTPTGNHVETRPTILILEPIADNGAATRREPIDPRDRFTLPDGSKAFAVDVEFIVDPSTGDPYAYQITLGDFGGR